MGTREATLRCVRWRMRLRGRRYTPATVRIGLACAVLTGAGVSAESGVPTFRDADGLWNQYRVQDLATPSAFARDPKAGEGWNRMSAARRRSLLFAIFYYRAPEARRRRIDKMLEDAAAVVDRTKNQEK